MNAGYSSGWCEESFNVPLVTSEIQCQAKGDSHCRFIMAHPSKIKDYIDKYTQTAYIKYEHYNKIDIPEFLNKKGEVMKTKKFLLTEQDMPRKWYNIMADMPTPMEPPLHPGTGQPAGPDDLAPIFPMNLIEQEVSTDRWIDIPEEVLDKYAIWRPSPLFRARNLEKALDTPAKIYYKNEVVSPAGSHTEYHRP